MPARVDYASRFEFFRQACFALVRDRGMEALTRRTLAAELGCGVNTVRRLVDPSVDLAVLAADEVVTRRRVGRWGRRSEDPAEQARHLLRRLFPEDDSHVDEELVWLKLVAASRSVPGRERPQARYVTISRSPCEGGPTTRSTTPTLREQATGQHVSDARAAALSHHLRGTTRGDRLDDHGGPRPARGRRPRGRGGPSRGPRRGRDDRRVHGPDHPRPGGRDHGSAPGRARTWPG